MATLIKSQLKFASRGEAGVYVLHVSEELAKDSQAVDCLVITLAPRAGGLLMAVPFEVIDEDRLIDALSAGEEDLVGPSKMMQAELVEEGEDGTAVKTGQLAKFYAVDFHDSVLAFMRDYDTEVDILVKPFEDTKPFALLDLENVDDMIKSWASEKADGRLHFYSAREEEVENAAPKSHVAGVAKPKATPKRISNQALMEQVAALQVQVQQMALSQAKAVPTPSPSAAPARELVLGGPQVPKMPRLSDGLGGLDPGAGLGKAAAALAGPPPKVRHVLASPPQPMEQEEPYDPLAVPKVADPILLALTQQSSAITNLVAHLAGGGDPMMDLAQSSSTTLTSGTRGAQRRERMQADLATGNSSYFLQLQQQIHKKLHPSVPVPKTEAEMTSAQLSMCTYLERTGGYKNSREAALVMWVLAHAVDAAARGDLHLTREVLALLTVSMEQSVYDGGSWSIAYLMTLMEEPPVTMLQERTTSVGMIGKPFSPLVPAAWSTVVLSYMKELEVLSNRKQETTSPKKSGGQKKEEDSEKSPSPKRRVRFPKRPPAPKGAGDQ